MISSFLAGALGLEMVGTVSELATLIKSNLSDNFNIQLDPRFAGLSENGQHCMDNGDSEHTGVWHVFLLTPTGWYKIRFVFESEL